LELSAHAWSTPLSKVSTDQSSNPAQHVLKYMHDTPSPLPSSGATIDLVCGAISVTIGAENLSRFLPIIDTLVKAKGKGVDGLNDALLTIPHVSEAVANACIGYLNMPYLKIPLPTSSPVPDATKKMLLEYTHFAHALGIQPLMNAAMHALTTMLYLHPDSFADDLSNKCLLEENTFKGNPARKVFQGHIFPELLGDGKGGLYCQRAYEQTCAIDQEGVKTLWIEKEVTLVCKKMKKSPVNTAGSWVV
jgi:hypothetical protein